MSGFSKSTIEYNLCLGHANTIATLKGRVHIFKREYVWQLDNNLRIENGYPRKIKDIFIGLPDYVTHIDAIYERSVDGYITLFHGKCLKIYFELSFIYKLILGCEYWTYNQDMVLLSSSKLITDFGFDTTISKIDAAFVWNKNNYTYIFAGTIFLRYEESTKSTSADYPQKISDRWRGIPNNIDAVTCFPNGKD